MQLVEGLTDRVIQLRSTNNLAVIRGLRFGSRVAFLPEHVISIVPSEDAPVFEPALKRQRSRAKITKKK